MLRSYVNLSHNDRDEWLDCAEFAINKSRSSATGCSPFELVFHVRLGVLCVSLSLTHHVA